MQNCGSATLIYNEINLFIVGDTLRNIIESHMLKKDGTVVAVGYGYVGQSDDDGWKDIKIPE